MEVNTNENSKIVHSQGMEFKELISHNVIKERARSIAKRIGDEHKDDNPVFICVLRGAIMFAADMIREFDYNCVVEFVKVASYTFTKRGEISEMIGLNINIKDRTVIIIEDIVDTGNTIEYVIGKLKEKEPKCIKVATMLLKPDVYKKDFPIDYIGFSIPNVFVVGNGLDYNEELRNLKGIYMSTSSDEG